MCGGCVEDADATSRGQRAQRQNYAEEVRVASACKHVSRSKKQVRELWTGNNSRQEPARTVAVVVLGRRRIVSEVNKETKRCRACRCRVKCLINSSPGSRYQYAGYALARSKPKAGGLFSKEREIVKNVVISWEQLVVMWWVVQR